MLVGAGQEISLRPQQALATRNGVADDGRIRVPDVRPRIHVINRCRDVELLCHEIVVDDAYFKIINHEGTRSITKETWETLFYFVDFGVLWLTAF